MNDTPRTNEREARNGNVLCGSANLDFARKLERELNEANQRIKELESEGDRAIACAMQGSKTCADAIWYRVRNKA